MLTIVGTSCRPFHGLANKNWIPILGLTPQGLCFRLLRRLRLHFLCKATPAAFSSVIHDADWWELFSGGETHAHIVSKLALSRLRPHPAQVLQSHNLRFMRLLLLFVDLRSDEKRAQSLPSFGLEEECYAYSAKQQKSGAVLRGSAIALNGSFWAAFPPLPHCPVEVVCKNSR